MSTCMTEVKATGREAKITGGVDPEGNSVWLLEISGEHRMTPVLANMGMVVVLLGPWLLAVSTDDYMEIFKDDIG
jgi:hypothetical protein